MLAGVGRKVILKPPTGWRGISFDRPPEYKYDGDLLLLRHYNEMNTEADK